MLQEVGKQPQKQLFMWCPNSTAEVIPNFYWVHAKRQTVPAPNFFALIFGDIACVLSTCLKLALKASLAWMPLKGRIKSACHCHLYLLCSNCWASGEISLRESNIVSCLGIRDTAPLLHSGKMSLSSLNSSNTLSLTANRQSNVHVWCFLWLTHLCLYQWLRLDAVLPLTSSQCLLSWQSHDIHRRSENRPYLCQLPARRDINYGN